MSNVAMLTTPHEEVRDRLPYRPGISKLAYAEITKALLMSMEVHESVVHKQGVEEKFRLKVWNTDKMNVEFVDVLIQKHPTCSCKEFQDRLIAGKRYLACPQIYYVFLMVLGQDVNNSMHIHQDKIAANIVHDMLTQAKRASKST
ncbi:hypothetical protein GOP47_0007659 [Adiantum capillus-veneris]|uniref:Uncharacterized protein n=1 Tax=Adiantum capillus-veneris TaxID=13818 RepID=A0A9D4V148_ADICA|nr:hypothetical protein GOP47_0007659 [Adiantum capillus-veneris]